MNEFLLKRLRPVARHSRKPQSSNEVPTTLGVKPLEWVVLGENGSIRFVAPRFLSLLSMNTVQFCWIPMSTSGEGSKVDIGGAGIRHRRNSYSTKQMDAVGRNANAHLIKVLLAKPGQVVIVKVFLVVSQVVLMCK
jgi:hypothetical protein